MRSSSSVEKKKMPAYLRAESYQVISMMWSHFFVLGPVSNFSRNTTLWKTGHPKSRV